MTQTQDQNDPTISCQYLAFLFVTSMAIIGPTLRYYLLRSKNVEPKVFCEGNFARFEMPQDTKREIITGCGLETEVVEIKIEFWTQNSQAQENFESFTLNKASPAKDIRITPGQYFYKWKTRESKHSWSEWTEKSIVSKAASCKPVSCDPLTAKDQEKVHSVEDGSDFAVLVAGRAGGGKSSLINSLLSAIEGQWKKVADTGPAGLTNTQSLKEYELRPGKVFYDMPGWDKSFDLELFKKVVEGKIDDVSVSHLQELSQRCRCPRGCSHDVEQTSTGNARRKIDVVILVISATCLSDNKDFYQDIIKLLRPLEIPCIGVVTRLDEVDLGHGRISREKFFEDARAHNLCREFSLDSMFPLVNYLEDQKTFQGVDEHLVNLFRKVQEKSQFNKPKARN